MFHALYMRIYARYNSSMNKRLKFNTSVAPDTRKGLKRIAKREKLVDHRGYPSEGRAIDWLLEKELASGQNGTGDKV